MHVVEFPTHTQMFNQQLLAFLVRKIDPCAPNVEITVKHIDEGYKAMPNYLDVVWVKIVQFLTVIGKAQPQEFGNKEKELHLLIEQSHAVMDFMQHFYTGDGDFMIAHRMQLSVCVDMNKATNAMTRSGDVLAFNKYLSERYPLLEFIWQYAFELAKAKLPIETIEDCYSARKFFSELTTAYPQFKPADGGLLVALNSMDSEVDVNRATKCKALVEAIHFISSIDGFRDLDTPVLPWLRWRVENLGDCKLKVHWHALRVVAMAHINAHHTFAEFSAHMYNLRDIVTFLNGEVFLRTGWKTFHEVERELLSTTFTQINHGEVLEHRARLQCMREVIMAFPNTINGYIFEHIDNARKPYLLQYFFARLYPVLQELYIAHKAELLLVDFDISRFDQLEGYDLHSDEGPLYTPVYPRVRPPNYDGSFSFCESGD